ncbi:hypothetical protein Pmani_006708 [Petrolisthes manimaculis]|uniref:Uncharacterized protein n=1 Tax=Petrolisthes manimaculis TaxID=1843537 RepID=A0AAE1QCA4_9EUCA|nr:hypothetical protein Pmani_006708 [Petrolisthes manimaculis]
MDPNTLKVLLDSQNQSFISAVDIIVDQFKSRITDMETKISDLTSLEFTQAEVTDPKSEVKELQKSDSVKQTTINELQTHVKDIEQRTDYQEDYSRRNNLHISGMEELPSGETWEQTTKTVQTILEDKFQLPPANLERAHRIGPGGHSQPRTIVVRFEKFGDREAVLRNARKLKGAGDTVRPAADSQGMAGCSDGSASTGRGEEAASTVETGTKLKKDRKKK